MMMVEVTNFSGIICARHHLQCMIFVKPHNSHERLDLSPCTHVENDVPPRSEECVKGHTISE